MTTGLIWVSNKGVLTKVSKPEYPWAVFTQLLPLKILLKKLNKFSQSKGRDRKRSSFLMKGPMVVIGSSEEVFKRDVFLPLVDSVISSLIEQRNN